MAAVRFERASAPAGSVTFSRNPEQGAVYACEFFQPVDRSGGGSLYIYNKGIFPEDTIVLSWPSISSADKAALDSFIRTVAVGAVNVFTYYDHNGASHAVRLMTPKPEFTERYGRFAVRLLLRIEG